MKRTIGIIAPFIDRSHLNMDFTLRLRRNNRELTLAAFYELARKGFKAEVVSRGNDYGGSIPAAGYYLESILHQNGYDTILTNQYDTQTIKTIAEKNPFCVCVSTTMILTTGSLLDLFSSIRSVMPGTPIIAGGVFIWKNYLQYIKPPDSRYHVPFQHGMLFNPGNERMDADVLVVGSHGKSSFLEVLKELEKGKNASFDHIPNLCIPDAKGFNFTKREEELVDYNEDFTRWDLIDEIPAIIPLRTSIGCPYRCRFCDFCKLYPRVFLRSKESLTRELNLVHKSLRGKPAIIHVSDENVFETKKRLYEVCDTIADSGISHWVGFMRGGEYSTEEMAAIKRSGLMMGKIGVESGDPGQLKRMNKQQKIENVKRGVEQFDANGISVVMTFVVGFPGETRQTIRNTSDFLNHLSLTNLSVGYQLYPLVLFPLSELAEPSARTTWKIEGFMEKWSHYTMNSEKVTDFCLDIFNEVTNLPYAYTEESYLFNMGKFPYETRKRLFQLRHQLTLNWIKQLPWNQIEPILKLMAQEMKITVDRIDEGLRNEISGFVKF